jgi:hypothetical protein
VAAARGTYLHRLQALDYRPKERPDEVLIVHPKNGEAVWFPLFAVRDGKRVELFSELMKRMDAAKANRVGTGPFFVRDWIDQKAGVPLPWATAAGDLRHMSRNVKAILRGAELDGRITFTSFRHGGMTELGDRTSPTRRSARCRATRTPRC